MAEILKVVTLCTVIMMALALVRFTGSRRVEGVERAILAEKAKRYLISAGVLGLLGLVLNAFASPSAPSARSAAVADALGAEPAPSPIAADAAPATAAQNAWTLVPGRGAIGIGPEVTHEILRKRLGDSLVVTGRIDVGAGRTVPGTVLFPLDPTQRLEVLWQDTVRLERPATLRVRGSTSRWRVHPGIALGSPGPDGAPLREISVSLVP
jgi:hypothetical protein